MREGEELVLEPFQRLIEDDMLMAYKHEGFWRSMDTLRDRQIARGHGRAGRHALAARWRPSRRGAISCRRRLMIGLGLARPGERLSVLCLGAHSDDIEIGAGGTILSLIAAGARLDVHWCVLSAAGSRAAEAAAVGRGLPARRCRAARSSSADFDDSYFPAQSRESRTGSIDVRGRFTPDVILTHRRDDAHQDHREVNQLTWNVFRDHLILEYEIPKWDGDLGQPNVYVPLSDGDHGAQDRRCSTPISARSGPRTGSMPRPSAAWRGCAAWSAGRRSSTPRPSPCEKRGSVEPRRRLSRLR